MADIPILVLGNKIDAPKAVPEEDLRQIFGLHGITTGKVSYIVMLLLRHSYIHVG